MQSDDIINQAMKAGGGMLDGNAFFLLEGNVERNEFRILPLQKAYVDNYISFTFQLNHGFIMLGIFNTEEAAEEFILLIRTLGRDEAGNRINR